MGRAKCMDSGSWGPAEVTLWTEAGLGPLCQSVKGLWVPTFLESTC